MAVGSSLRESVGLPCSFAARVAQAGNHRTPQLQIQFVAHTATTTTGNEGTCLSECVKISGCGGFGHFSQGTVFTSIHASFETCCSRFEHAQNDTALPIA